MNPITGGITAAGGGTAFGFPGLMPNALPLLVCLGLISGCAVAMTVTMVWTARDLRRTLRRVNTILPTAEKALRDVHQALDHVRRLLTRADRATRHVETVVHQVCDTAEHTVHKWLGNGAGADPRRHHRSG